MYALHALTPLQPFDKHVQTIVIHNQLFENGKQIMHNHHGAYVAVIVEPSWKTNCMCGNTIALSCCGVAVLLRWSPC